MNLKVAIDTFREEETSDQVFLLARCLHGDGERDLVDGNTQADLYRQDIPDRGKLSVVVKKPVVFFNIHA